MPRRRLLCCLVRRRALPSYIQRRRGNFGTQNDASRIPTHKLKIAQQRFKQSASHPFHSQVPPHRGTADARRRMHARQEEASYDGPSRTAVPKSPRNGSHPLSLPRHTRQADRPCSHAPTSIVQSPPRGRKPSAKAVRIKPMKSRSKSFHSASGLRIGNGQNCSPSIGYAGPWVRGRLVCECGSHPIRSNRLGQTTVARVLDQA